MADKAEKPKKSKSKAKKEEQGVLAALPSTRPQRIGGGRRASAPKTFKKPAAAATGSRPKRSRSKPAAAKKPAAAARRQAAAPRTFEPTLAAESAAGADTERAAGAADARAGAAQPGPRPAPEPRPRAVREGAPGIRTSGERGRGDERTDAGSREHGRPSGVEIVTTAVQAAGELTQIGLTIGGQIVKRAVERLPKP
jgi:hypothetical protein